MKLNTVNRRQTRYTGPRISEKPKPMPKKYNTMTFATDNTKGLFNASFFISYGLIIYICVLKTKTRFGV